MLFAAPGARPRDIVIGQYIGMTILILCAMGLAALTLAFPREPVRLLGLLPLAIGLKHGWEAWRARTLSAPAATWEQGSASALSVALVTIANGGDNVAVYVPLFARRGLAEGLTAGAVLEIMVAVWCLAIQGLLATPRLKRWIGLGRRWLVPGVLVVLGLSILVFA